MKITTEYIRNFPYDTAVVVNVERKWIWLKVCRVAGTSIFRHGMVGQATITGGTGYQPTDYKAWLRDITDAELAEYWVWTIVRNPYDRLLSALAYLHIPLDFFIDDPMAAMRPGLRTHALPQYWYAQVADHVARYENLRHDWRVIEERIGQPRQRLPRVNCASHGDYRDALSDRARAMVEMLYHRDFELLGYKWGDA